MSCSSKQSFHSSPPTLEQSLGTFLELIIPKCDIYRNTMSLLTIAAAIYKNRRNNDAVEKGKERRRRDRRIPRIALQKPTESAWFVLYGSGKDQALITLTGFDHKSLNFILQLFQPIY